MNKKMQRREFMKTVAIGGVAATLSHHFCASFIEKSNRPDILLIMPDQMRGDCLSILGHSAVKTSQLDKLAKQGVLFRRAYTTVASCIPARYALLTGLYPQTSGVVGFQKKAFQTPSLPELLVNAGYSTILVGRNMHQAAESGDCGYQQRILGSTYVNNDEYDEFLRKAAPETGGIKELVKKVGATYNHWQAKPWPLADDLHPTAWVVAQSLKVVEATDEKQHLFLTTSFYAPHPPLIPPKQYFDKYKQQKLPLPAHGGWVNWQELSPKGNHNGHRVLLKDETLHNAQSGYFGLIEHLDNQISSLIHRFKARSEKAGRPWIIVVTSDHGEMLGDHGYFRKCEPYEGSANIPFIFSASSELQFKDGLQVNQPVCLEDILPTLLALAGIKIPTHIDGVNLLPILRGQKQVIRKWLHFEHAPCYSQEQAYHALTDGIYKYIWRPLDGSEHLFDLDKDPKEEFDLSKETSFNETIKLWRSRLAQRLINRPEGFTQNGNLIPGRPYHPLNEGTLDTKIDHMKKGSNKI